MNQLIAKNYLQHPTVLVFHHRMKTPLVEQERSNEFCQDIKLGRYCGAKVPPADTPTLGECDRDSACNSPEKCERPKPFYICYQGTIPPSPVVPERSCTETMGTINVKQPKLCDSPSGVILDPPDFCAIKTVGRKDLPCAAASKYYGRSSEVHGNFVWFSHPCHYTRRIRFLYG